MEGLQKYFDTIESALSQIEYAPSPDGLYAPVRYELSLGGKRVRPLLALLACEMFGGDCRRAIGVSWPAIRTHITIVMQNRRRRILLLLHSGYIVCV